MTAGDRALSVGGDAIGQFPTGDHNVLVTANASLVQVHQAAPRVKPQRRAHIERLPNGAATPLGRDDEAALVLRSIADNEPVQVYGPDGLGKTTLIRHAALELDGRDGVVFLDGYRKDLDDLLQSVFEACYDSPGYRPSDGELEDISFGEPAVADEGAGDAGEGEEVVGSTPIIRPAPAAQRSPPWPTEYRCSQMRRSLKPSSQLWL
ncbi:hypothetical protein OG381_00400 [Streptomyces sp. NBC_00490]|uniref:hypothetical protein n=1 Tax=Streptomyces sp. NBC_00490 TaxID=2903657 RepID=UPI002E174554